MTERLTRLPSFPPRPFNAHKGTFGRVLIIGGSPGMSGAAALAGLGALRGGAGLVYLAVPVSIVEIVAAIESSYLTIPLPCCSQGGISIRAQSILDERLPAMSACAIGPGLGRHPATGALVCKAYQTCLQPLVVDADALNELAVHLTAPDEAAGPRILTPHPGEFARLTNRTIAEVQQHRDELAIEFAARFGVILLLKGSGTVITDGRKVAINQTGNPGMATGGSGDVLTGLIAALLAQGMSPFDAAQLGAHLHGIAGDLAAESLSEPGLIASDLPTFLPAAIQQFLESDAPPPSAARVV